MGCAHQRDVSIVKDRMEKLQPLSRYTSTVCEVETQPTQPALARFSQMYPAEVDKLRPDAWTFQWRQRESRCEVTPQAGPARSPVVKAQLGFVEAALCVLGQVFFVNSPFDEIQLGPEHVRRKDDMIHLSKKAGSEHGLYLDPRSFFIITRTPAKGQFAAHYSQVGEEWLPDRMEHKPENMQILVDQIEYGERIGSRRVFKSMMVSVGTERPLAHSQLIVRNCQRL